MHYPLMMKGFINMQCKKRQTVNGRDKKYTTRAKAQQKQQQNQHYLNEDTPVSPI